MILGGVLRRMRVVCTTVMRGSTDEEMTGRFFEVELPSGRIIKSMNVPSIGSVSGPRGGTRGGRGIAVYGGKTYAAVHNRIFVYDREWNLLGEISNPLVAGHHELQVDSAGIWCCSTLTDSITRLDFTGKILYSYWASEDENFVAWLGRKRILWDKSFDYASLPLGAEEVHSNKQFHINTVRKMGNEVYAYDCNYSALFRFWPSFRPVVINPAWDHAHNVYLSGVEILVNNSAMKTFEKWRLPKRSRNGVCPDATLLERTTIVPGEERSTQFSKSGWVRGRIDLGRNEFLVGCNPASIHHILDGKVINVFQLSDDVNEAIHGLASATQWMRWRFW